MRREGSSFKVIASLFFAPLGCQADSDSLRKHSFINIVPCRNLHRKEHFRLNVRDERFATMRKGHCSVTMLCRIIWSVTFLTAAFGTSRPPPRITTSHRLFCYPDNSILHRVCPCSVMDLSHKVSWKPVSPMLRLFQISPGRQHHLSQPIL